MITAIINRLKTGSIQNVIPRGHNVSNPDKPYVVVWKDTPVQQAGSQNSLNEFVVNAHFPKGWVNEIEDYIEVETYQLLHDQLLTTRDNRKVKIEATSSIGAIQTGNDDGTISMSRVFTAPGIYE